MKIGSPAFKDGESIPQKFSCKGENISPALNWSDAPAGVKSYVLITDDPDAPIGTFVHWVIYNIPPASKGLPEAIPPDARLSDGTQQGKNGAQRTGYMGPCPPSGTHRYFFKLYALNDMLNPPAGASKDQLLKAMEGHILAQAQLMGTYTRQ